MALVNLTADTFRSTTAEGMVFIDFWAAWCGPCHMFAPIFEEAAGRHPDIVFAKIDTEAEPELSGALDIRSIPTLMVFRDGILLGSFPGVQPAEALDDLAREVRALDMDDVRRKIAEAQADVPPA